jgi:hypothetical protein
VNENVDSLLAEKAMAYLNVLFFAEGLKVTAVNICWNIRSPDGYSNPGSLCHAAPVIALSLHFFSGNLELIYLINCLL